MGILILLVISILLGVAAGLSAAWLRSRRERKVAEAVGFYVDTLMADGIGSDAESAHYHKHMGDKEILKEMGTARDLFVVLKDVI